MGAEFFTETINASDEHEVGKKYEDILLELEYEQACVEADYLFSNDVDYIPDGEHQPEGIIQLKDKALEAYSKDLVGIATNYLATYLIAVDYETIYTYTGTFLSADVGLNFLEAKDKEGNSSIREFTSVEKAEDYIREHHEKWDKPMVAKIANSGTWVIGAWCSS